MTGKATDEYFQISEAATLAHLQKALKCENRLVREHAAEEIERRKTQADFDRRAAMDKGLDSFIIGLKKIQEIHVALAQLEHPHPASFNLYYFEYLQTVLWQAGIDMSMNYGVAKRGTTFTSILEAQAGYTTMKTGDIMGDAKEAPVAEPTPEVTCEPEGAVLTWEKNNTALDSWAKPQGGRADKVHTIQH